MPQAQRHRARVGGRGAHLGARFVAGEGEQHLELGVVREAARGLHPQGAALAVELEAALAGALQRTRDPMGVPQQEVGGVDQHALARARRHVEAPQHGGGERIAHGRALHLGLGARRPLEVRRHQQDPRARAQERHHPLGSELGAVEPHAVGAQAGRQADQVQQVLPLRTRLDVELAAGGVPPGGQEAGQLLQGAGQLLDRRRRLGLAAPRRVPRPLARPGRRLFRNGAPTEGEDQRHHRRSSHSDHGPPFTGTAHR